MIEALAACLTALLALVALVGVKVQLDETDRLARLQSARDTYRGHLALAITTPEFAAPIDGCALLDGPKAVSYEAFVDHLLYSAEQSLSVEDGWDQAFLDQLAPHQAYVCSAQAPNGDTPEVTALLKRYRSESCPAMPTCR